MTVYEQYCGLNLDGSLFGFAKGSETGGYDCTPVGMTVLGWDNAVHFGTIAGYGEAIFAINPEAFGEGRPVFLLARSFSDFLSLILAAGHTAALEQICSFPFTREQFEAYVNNEGLLASEERQKAFDVMQSALKLTEIADPYGYVKALQKDFDSRTILMTEEYYDNVGEEPPEPWKKAEETKSDGDFFSVTAVRIRRKKEEN